MTDEAQDDDGLFGSQAVALLLIDVLNPYEHEGAQRLADSAQAAVPRAARLLAAARRSGSTVVFVNDIHGDWTTDRDRLSRRALAGAHAHLVEPLLPRADEPFLIKGRHSAFWQTPLEGLLREVGATRLVLAGQATEQCVLYSAIDAHMRRFELTIVPAACAHIDDELARAAVRMMSENLGAATPP